MSFWENVDRLVTEQNTSYRWLAGRLEVSETTVSSWRRTGVSPRSRHSVLIAKALKTTVESLEDMSSDDPWFTENRSLISKLQVLPSDHLKEVSDFVDFKIQKVSESIKDRSKSG
jgi:hypothetical protein